MKVLLDTNVWLRFFLKDEIVQFDQVASLFSFIDRGAVVPYVSTIILLEINFILKKIYKLPESEVFILIKNILEFRGITLIEKTNFIKAFDWHQKYKVKLADCLIANQLPDKATLVTFDHEFRKIKGLNSATPQEILRKL